MNHEVVCGDDREIFVTIIAELAERSPIIIQNSSNPSSRKSLDVRPYDRTTVPRARQRHGFVQKSSGRCTGLRVGQPGF